MNTNKIMFRTIDAHELETIVGGFASPNEALQYGKYLAGKTITPTPPKTDMYGLIPGGQNAGQRPPAPAPVQPRGSFWSPTGNLL